ncbi:MAG: hypothetical protein LBS75_05515 [Synergistaceae bacterium]|jgi:hypothetical protein|nr:hypothetical protein [Synergistaceae bacterium]
MRDEPGSLRRYLAGSAYAKIQGGAAGSACRVTITDGDAVTRMLRADAALSVILDRLHGMRDLAERCASTPLAEAQRLSCQADVDRLKDDISRISGAIARAEGSFGGLAASEEIEESLRRIDKSVDRVSRMADCLSSRKNDERISGWMDSIYGPQKMERPKSAG